MIDELICPKCESGRIIGHNICPFDGVDGYYQDWNCFDCEAAWRNFYKTILDEQKVFDSTGSYES
jgi:hypothetical protein